ncbi:histidine kinase [Candidatus Magnetomoraceae bacterium gMMP-13]
MIDLKTVNTDIALLKKHSALAILIWTAMITASFAWYYVHENNQIMELARKEALTAFKKDTAFRYWGTKHGGVYVPITEKTQPNEYLKNILEREIITPSGKKLTLMNPAYMVRQMMEEYSKLYNVRGHITSLNLLNPKNVPDDWERQALKSFENGIKEVFEIVPSASGDHLRLMRPLFIKEGCLKCHEYQNYKKNDVRGGTSIAVPMSTYYNLKYDIISSIAITYSFIWLSGLISIGFIFRQTKIRLIERNQAEEELTKYREHLETLVDERTIALKEKVEQHRQAEDALKKSELYLKKAKEDAETANRAKSTFLANMSHELRSPLNAILGFTRVINRNQSIPHAEKENLAIIRRSGEHLLSLINDVLDMSKIEAGRIILNKNNVDIYCLLDDMENMFCLKAEEKGLQLIFECDANVPQYIWTDESKLRQVLVNFLGNALKFTKEGGISVMVRRLPVQDMKTKKIDLQFKIKDTGEGIAPDELDSLFEAFVQTETGRKSQEGTGLGLSISQKFIQMMGGDITVESEVGRGTVFRFEIQTEAKEGMDIETPQPERHVIALMPDQPCYRILIVDDRKTNRLLLFRLLTLPGFEIREAENGKDAVEIWEKWEPHLICMDMRMPVMDGYEATKRIKSTIKGQATAIIAVTASVFEEERAVVLSAGCDDFVRKPFKESEIFNVIHKHLGVRYVYEKEVDSPVPEFSEKEKQKALTPEALGVLPHELLIGLEQASVQGDTDRVESLIKDIRTHDAELADALTALIADFEYDKILELIEKDKAGKK